MGNTIARSDAAVRHAVGAFRVVLLIVSCIEILAFVGVTILAYREFSPIGFADRVWLFVVNALRGVLGIIGGAAFLRTTGRRSITRMDVDAQFAYALQVWFTLYACFTFGALCLDTTAFGEACNVFAQSGSSGRSQYIFWWSLGFLALTFISGGYMIGIFAHADREFDKGYARDASAARRGKTAVYSPTSSRDGSEDEYREGGSEMSGSASPSASASGSSGDEGTGRRRRGRRSRRRGGQSEEMETISGPADGGGEGGQLQPVEGKISARLYADLSRALAPIAADTAARLPPAEMLFV